MNIQMTDMYSKNHKTVYERQGVVTNIASVPPESPGRQSVACKIIKTAVAFAIAVLAATPASGQQTYGLRECVETGLRQNYSIRIVRGEEQITKNNAIPGQCRLPAVRRPERRIQRYAQRCPHPFGRRRHCGKNRRCRQPDCQRRTEHKLDSVRRTRHTG